MYYNVFQGSVAVVAVIVCMGDSLDQGHLSPLPPLKCYKCYIPYLPITYSVPNCYNNCYSSSR